MKAVWCSIFLFYAVFIGYVGSQTCQCIQPDPSALNCLGYDSKLQADTIDEAIASFPDLSMNDGNVDATASDVGCVTQECQDCRKDMRKQLQKVGLLAKDINDIISTQMNTNSTCTKYRFSIEKQKLSVDPTGTVSLCSSCWVWRRLPDNYRPQYINELVCDNSDGECLSGYATCAIGHRTFEATRNDNGVMTQVTLTAGSYCECRISKSSSLQSLVTGSGISGTYSPLHNQTGVL
ncbi:Protein CBG09882 [Caenorhabditis briggsae]|uniref:Protein CBG09882 n=1 Tax=Caenorhabditis briggsae TaxID=6238 RepID=A8X9W1_CAEBR|nr:Protein CBG09882 [Caenorhabditis briggsae]CAP29426.2 Protein CBG09882 [Caenorhabditis briggsae]